MPRASPWAMSGSSIPGSVADTATPARQSRTTCAPVQHAIGVIHHGGFGSHVVVPHARYLIDPGNVDPALAATYACSGIADPPFGDFQAGQDRARRARRGDRGSGGVGLAAVAMLKALGYNPSFRSIPTSAPPRQSPRGADRRQRRRSGAAPYRGRRRSDHGCAGLREQLGHRARGFDLLGKGGTLWSPSAWPVARSPCCWRR